MAQVQPAYDAAGNIATVTTTLGAIPGVAGTGGSETQAFCYDAQDRLVWASTQATGSCGTAGSEGLSGAGYTASYSYDPVGRIASQSVTTSGGGRLAGAANGTYSYGDAAHFHAVTAVGNNGTPTYSAAYDAAGDMTCRALNSSSCNNPTPAGQALTYDVLRRLVSWQDGSTSSEQYAYDGEGNRVWRQTVSGSTTTTTVSILGVEDVTTVSGGATTATRYYALPGGVTATRDSSGLVYEATDQLGTPIAALNLFSGITGEQLRAPYGQARYAANGTGSGGGMRTPYGFTGQREDTAPSGASGLDYFNARSYDTATGRFTSADDAQPGLGDPSGQDNYAYVGGMVERATDPSGHAYAEDELGQKAENAGPVSITVGDVTTYINLNATEQGGAVAMLTGVNGGGAADAAENAADDLYTSTDTVTQHADGSVSISTNANGADPAMGAELDSETQFNTEETDAQRAEREPAHEETPSGGPKPPGGPEPPPTAPTGPHGPDTPPAGPNTEPVSATDTITEDLYVFGNSQQPGGARSPRDLITDPSGQITEPNLPSPGRGASTTTDPLNAGLTGHYFRLPRGTILPDGLAILPDGADVGGPMPWGHRTFYPTRPMSIDEFNGLFRGLPWVHAGRIP